MNKFWSKTIKSLRCVIGLFSRLPKSKTGKVFLLVFIFAGVFLAVQPTHAIFQAIVDGFLYVFTEIMLALARLAIALSVFALKLFIEISKYNGYIDTPTVVLGWAMVRDVANMFFVIVLLIIAFATILGIEQYEWKKTLVKFILAAIFINFSRLICGILIDVAHVFTITFIVAVSATAGGNLINMFHIDEIFKATSDYDLEKKSIDVEVFAGALIALLFSGLTLLTIGAYLIVMIARVVVLWALIILSPIAFILQVLPTTQQYAKEWWDKFGKQVLVAPIMVFFLWLAFATLGTGTFVKENLNINMVSGEAKQVAGEFAAGKQQQLSLSQVSSWENMANILIAAAFLFVGLGVVQKLGVVGGGLVSGAVGFGKRVATIASGYAAGRWLAGKGRAGVVGAAKKVGGGVGGRIKNVAMNLPVIGGKSWKRTGERIDEFRRQNKWVKHVPLIGKYNEEYQEKLDARVKQIKELQKAARMKNMSKTGDALISRAALSVPNLIMKKLGLKVRGKESGLFGLDALTARRNAAEEQELAAMQRGESNKQMRMTRNELELRIKATQLIEDTEDEHLRKWAKDKGIDISRISIDDLREENWSEFMAKDEDGNYINKEAKDLDKDIQDINKPAVGAPVEELSVRNMAQKIIQEQRLETSRTELEKAKSEGIEAVMQGFVAKNEQLIGRRAQAEVVSKIGQDIVEKLKNVELKAKFESALDDLRDAMRKGAQEANLLAEQNPFVKALLAAAQTEQEKADVDAERGDLMSEVQGHFIDMIRRGFKTPSLSAANEAKREADQLRKLGEIGRGNAVARNVALLANKGKNREDITNRMRRSAYAIMYAATEGGNIDDGLSSIAGMVNRLDLYEQHKGDEEKLAEYFSEDDLKDIRENKENYDSLRDAALHYNWIERFQDPKTGKTSWVDTSDVAASGTLQNFMITGGDREYVDRSDTIARIASEKGTSFNEAAIAYFQNKALVESEGDRLVNYDDYKKQMEEYQDLFRDASEELKLLAINAGHTQLGLNQVYDEDLGMVRPTSIEEQEAYMAGSLVKRKGVKLNPQSLGKYINAKGRQGRIERSKLRQTEIPQKTTLPGFDAIVMDRTRRMMLGVHKSYEKKFDENGNAILCESADVLKARGYGDYDIGLYDQMAQIISGVLADGGNTMALAVKSEYDNIDRYAAEAGFMKVTVAGTNQFDSDRRSDFTRKVSKYLHDKQDEALKKLEINKKQASDAGQHEFASQIQEQIDWIKGNINEELYKALETAAIAAESKEKDYEARYKGKEPTPEQRETEGGE